MRLALAEAEITHDARTEPIEAWASAVWDNTGWNLLCKAWRRQSTRRTDGATWKDVHGPAATCLFMSSELGWK